MNKNNTNTFSMNLYRHSRVYLVLIIFVATTFLSLFSLSMNAQAKAVSDMTADEQARSFSYYQVLGQCVGNNMKGTIKVSINDNGNALPVTWFDNNTASGNVYPERNIDCKKIADKALELWGWGTNGGQFLTDMGYTYNGTNTYSGPGGIGFSNERRDKFFGAVQAKVYGGNQPTLFAPAEYLMTYDALKSVCKVNDLGLYSNLTTTQKSAVDNNTTEGSVTYTKTRLVDIDKKSAEHGITYTAKDTSQSVGAEGVPAGPTDLTANLYGYRGGGSNVGGKTESCAQLVSRIGELSPAFAQYAQQNNITPPQAASGINGGSGKGRTTCGIEGIGWLVCPVLGFLATITDRAFDFLATSFLEVDAKLLDTSTATYSAWSAMRNFANIAFVIAFMIIIYSQLTSAGIGSYGIKKMLPRLIVAAVLVNTSYILCQLAVDISNILGYSLKGLFDGMGSYMKTGSTVSGDATGNGFGVAVIIAALLAGSVTLAFALSFPVLLAAIVALLVIIMILLARKAIIILLIIVAPLAFVAYLLPNTEHLFKKWQKMFTTLLLVFPIISVLFGSATLAAGIIKATNPNDNMTQLIAIGVAAMPLFLVPALLKGSVSAVGAIGAKLNSMGDKAQGKVGSRVGDTSRLGQFNKYRKGESDRRRALIQAGAYKGSTKNPLNWGRNATSSLNKSFNNSRVSGKFGDRSAASGISIADKIEDEEVGSAVKQISREAIGDVNGAEAYLVNKLRTAVKSGDTIATRAAYTALTEQGMGGIAKIQETLDEPEMKEALNSNTGNKNSLREHILTRHADVKTKDNRIMQWASGQKEDFSGTVDRATGDTNYLTGLTDAQVASQTARSIRGAQLSAEQARRILDDKVIQPNLRGDQREALESIAGPTTPATP